MVKVIQRTFLAAFTAVLGMFAALNVAQLIEHAFFPVLVDFDARIVNRGVDAVIVTGTVRKARSCDYMPPWTARTLSGRALRVEQAEEDKPNWAAGKIIFAPILVYGAGNESFEMFSQHKCHFGWSTITRLGMVKNRDE